MLEVLIHGFFGGGTSGFWGGQVVLVIHLSVGQVDFLTKFEPCACMYVCIHYTRFLTGVCVCVYTCHRNRDTNRRRFDHRGTVVPAIKIDLR